MAVLIHASAGSHGALWQGGAMDLIDVFAGKYQVCVLCADELQPDIASIPDIPPGVRIIEAPNDDSGRPFTPAQRLIAERAAKDVAQEYMRGSRILVSCFQGRNRSGLVMAMAIHLITGESGETCMRLVRQKVPGAIGNLAFVDYLMGLR